MNTFLPDQNFKVCALYLDDKRLFKQAIEARQIIDILTTGKTKSGKDYPLSMKHHPIVKAWSKNIPTLKNYFNCMVMEIDRREKWNCSFETYPLSEIEMVLPEWLNFEVCEMYKAHLIRKNSDFYKFDVDPTIPFDWSLINNSG